MKEKLMQGDEACAQAALTAGCRFFAGYPITPASEIVEAMSSKLPEVDGSFIQMEDELGSIAAVIGASWGGVKAMTATSGPGFSLMQEGLGYGIVTETPCVVVDVQRGGPSTGQPTFPSQQDVIQARYGSHGDYSIIVLAPLSVQEFYDVTIKAFNFAELYRTPVVILADEVVAHAREKISIHTAEDSPYLKARNKPHGSDTSVIFKPDEDGIFPMPAFGDGYNLLVEGQLHDETGRRAGHLPDKSAQLVKRLVNKIDDHCKEISIISEEMMDDADIAIVAYGTSARCAKAAIRKARDAGTKIGLVQLTTLWPFPHFKISEVSKQVKQIIVPEMNVGKISKEVQLATSGRAQVSSVPILGGRIPKPSEILGVIEA